MLSFIFGNKWLIIVSCHLLRKILSALDLGLHRALSSPASLWWCQWVILKLGLFPASICMHTCILMLRKNPRSRASKVARGLDSACCLNGAFNCRVFLSSCPSLCSICISECVGGTGWEFPPHSPSLWQPRWQQAQHQGLRTQSPSHSSNASMVGFSNASSSAGMLVMSKFYTCFIVIYSNTCFLL